MALRAEEMWQEAISWASSNDVHLSATDRKAIRSIFDAAEKTVTIRLEDSRYRSPAEKDRLSRYIDAQVIYLMSELRFGKLKSLAPVDPRQIIKSLCPGFWPFC